MTKDRRLGKGLAALLGTPTDEPSAVPPESGPVLSVHHADHEAEAESVDRPPPAEGGLLQLNVYEIDENPFQPRREFSEPEIVSLSESLKEHDMLQPVLVRRIGDRFQLISGERRLRAAIQAGWKTVPARLREADDRLVAELAIVENLQRKDLNPIEKALSFRRYLDQHQCPQDDLAKRLKIDRSTIANLLRLLELPPQIQKALGEGNLSAGHARALLPLGDEDQQNTFCDLIRREGLSVRATEQLVQEKIREEDAEPLSIAAGKPAAARTKNQQIASLEQELRMALGTKVDIKQSSRNRGRIVVHFSSHDEFERIRGILNDTGSDGLAAQVG